MDYEKKYKEALERAKRLYEQGTITESLSHIFPELKESEDERIRKCICLCLEECVHNDIIRDYEKDKCLAWLEKQQKPADVEEPNFFDDFRKSDVEVDSNEDGLIAETIRYKKEQKPDIVEPKFKVGDWIIRSAEGFKHNTYLIKEVKDYYVCEELKGRRVTFTFNDVHKNFKLWSIQDAKDGDFLVAKGKYYKEYIFIYSKMTDDDVISTHCGYDVIRNTFDKTTSRFGRVEDFYSVCPATKEQRDLLFQKMKEAGYEWDAEKKELKKIEQKPAWSEEDETVLNNLIYALANDRIGNNRDEYVDWLKSLRPQNRWKPSDEQMNDLKRAIDSFTFEPDYLQELYNDLKKLKGE